MRQTLRMPQFVSGHFEQLLCLVFPVQTERRRHTGFAGTIAQSHYSEIAHIVFSGADILTGQSEVQVIILSITAQELKQAVGFVAISGSVIGLRRKVDGREY